MRPPLRDDWDGVSGMAEKQRVIYRALQRRRDDDAERGDAHELFEAMPKELVQELIFHALLRPKGGRASPAIAPKLTVPLVVFNSVIKAQDKFLPVAMVSVTEVGKYDVVEEPDGATCPVGSHVCVASASLTRHLHERQRRDLAARKAAKKKEEREARAGKQMDLVRMFTPVKAKPGGARQWSIRAADFENKIE